jgi:hypothetical protein
MAICAERIADTNRQNMVFIRQPGISDGAFQLRMGNSWFCKLLFKISTKTDTGMQQHECAYVSLLEDSGGVKWAKKSRSYCEYCANYVYCAYIAFYDRVSPQPGWMTSILNNLSAGNTHKCCMSLHSAPYWEVFPLFQWVRKGQHPLTYEKNQRTFLELLVTKARTAAMDVGGGT